jgi:hypothetical protein
VDGLRDGRSHEVVEDARSRGDARALWRIEAERWRVADDSAALRAPRQGLPRRYNCAFASPRVREQSGASRV